MKVSVQELLIVLAIVILIFGPTQIPKLVKMFKKGATSMKEGLNGDDEEEEVADKSKKVKKSAKKAAVKEAADTDEEE